MKSEIRGPRSEVRVIIVAAFAAFALNAGAGAAERPIVQPDCRVSANGARSFGLKVDLLSLAQAKRPTKQVYVEEAVALWRPAPGQAVAANEAPGTVADVNAAVKTTEQQQPMTWAQVAGDHVRRHAGRYIAGAVVAVAGGAGYAIYQANKDDGGDDKAAPAEPTNKDSQNYQPANSPSVGSITTGDNSPVNLTINVTAMPPE